MIIRSSDFELIPLVTVALVHPATQYVYGYDFPLHCGGEDWDRGRRWAGYGLGAWWWSWVA
jgi:hypothetical protein